jgi:hypothetical protein
MAQHKHLPLVMAEGASHLDFDAALLVAERLAQVPDEIGVSDITYVRFGAGFIYLAIIMDIFTRTIKSIARDAVSYADATTWSSAITTRMLMRSGYFLSQSDRRHDSTRLSYRWGDITMRQSPGRQQVFPIARSAAFCRLQGAST